MTLPDPTFEVRLGAARFDPAVAGAEITDEQRDARVGTWLVQLTGPLRAAASTRLRGLGLRLRDYVPPFAYIERLAGTTVETVQADPAVRAVAEVSGEMKLAPAATQPLVSTDDGLTPYRALLVDDTDPAAIAAGLIAFGATDVHVDDQRMVGGRVSVRFVMDSDRVADLTTIGELQWIEPLPQLATDAAPGVAAQHATAEHAAAWALGLHGEGQVIGVIDDGPAALAHCYFRDAPDNTPGPQHRKVLQVRNGSQQAGRAHATFVAGCAAGDQLGEPPGTAPDRGGAWAARLVLGNFNDMASFGADPADGATSLLDELTRAAAAGATVHSNSWHALLSDPGDPTPYDLVAADVDTFTWTNEEQLVLGAAGNSREQQGPPGSAKNAVCVAAATANGTALGDGAPGPTEDGRQKPELMMIGCGVRSALSGTACDTGPRSACASSYATPYAAAAAALLRQHLGGTPSGALLKALLIGATDAPTGLTVPDARTGWGTVRLARCLAPELALWDVRKTDGLVTGERRSLTVDVAGPELRVVLTWTEPPGTPGAATAMINELVLEVRPPSGASLRGDLRRRGVPATQTNGVRDAVGMLSVDAPAPGRWTISVEALMVNVGDPGQGFAVAVFGATPVAVG